MRVTAVEEQKRGVLSVSLDGVPMLTIAREVAVSHGVKVGLALSPEQVFELSKADDLYRAHQAALRYLSYRPRSEKEVRDRLRRGGFRVDIVDKEVAKLKELALVNDATFAQFWKEGRENSRPRSQRVMKMELRRKGIDVEVIADVVKDVDEEAGAYQSASKKARSLGGLDEKAFYRRLGQLLQRRGYRYDLARRVVERLWQERQGADHLGEPNLG